MYIRFVVCLKQKRQHYCFIFKYKYKILKKEVDVSCYPIIMSVPRLNMLGGLEVTSETQSCRFRHCDQNSAHIVSENDSSSGLDLLPYR